MEPWFVFDTREYQRLTSDGDAWRLWGPYLSERAWGTVREDYSPDGNAWAYLSHDAALSIAYRWNEDGWAGISADKGRMRFPLAIWNSLDPILTPLPSGCTARHANHVHVV